MELKTVLKLHDLQIDDNQLIQVLHSTKDLEDCNGNYPENEEAEYNVYYDSTNEREIFEIISFYGTIKKFNPMSLKDWCAQMMEYEDFNDYFEDFYNFGLSGTDAYKELKEQGKI